MTCPFETRIDQAHKLKVEKYEHLNTDLAVNGYKPNIEAFEVGSRGYLTKDNKQRIKYCKSDIKLKTFTNNISALSVNSSYYIFLCRKESQWSDTPHLMPPL